MKHRSETNGLTRIAGLLVASSIFLLQPSAFAQVPSLINYQGRLLNGTNLVNGNVGLSLRLFNVPSGGTSLYEDSNTVAVVDGLYSTFIGDHPTNNALLAALTNSAVWVEVAVNGLPLTPRERLSSAAYSLSTRGFLLTANGSVILNSDENEIVANSWSSIGGGALNEIGYLSLASVIAGGYFNVVLSNNAFAVISGGFQNEIGVNADLAVIGGGDNNRIGKDSLRSVIGGGNENAIGANATNAVIDGGQDNSVGARSAFAVIGGGRINDISTNSAYAVVSGGYNNDIAANSPHAVIGGGQDNLIEYGSYGATIAGGVSNGIGGESFASVIAGGIGNQVSSNAPGVFIGSGSGNTVHRWAGGAAISGGELNSIGLLGSMATIGGGSRNTVRAQAEYAVIGGGIDNIIGTNSAYSVIPGGVENEIGSYADAAFAAGYQAKANHSGAFVWGDYSGSDIASTTNNQTTFRSTGGFRIFTSAAQTSGVTLAANAGSWTSISDVNAKEAFAPVNTHEVLAKVAAMPITTWRYKGQDAEIRHMGPTAQDFHAAFGLGDLPGTGITTIDADGVALAAIQALAKENEEFRMQNEELKKNNAELRTEIEAIKARLGM